MRVGDIVEVDVVEAQDSHAKVTFGEYTGALHITELTWDMSVRPLSVNSFICANKKLKVLVTAVEGDRFSMSIKRLVEDPWKNPPQVGSRHRGTVSLVTDYGWFVLLSRCFEGVLLKEKALALHSSGDQLSVIVESCDPASHRISLVEEGYC